MGCDDYPHIGDHWPPDMGLPKMETLAEGRYQLYGDPVAELWNDKLARRFPHTSHRTCFQAMRLVDGQYDPQPFTPARCQDWHCPKCGESCGMNGHRACDTIPPAADQ